MPALYLALDPMTAIKEAAQGFAHKFEPYVLCTYEIDCEDMADFRTEVGRRPAGVALEDMACAGSRKPPRDANRHPGASRDA